MIVLTVVIHVLGLGLFTDRAVPALSVMMARGHRTTAFIVVMGTTVLLASILHGIEAMIWAAAYLMRDALPNARSAMLYSLSSMTTFGHAHVYLQERWQLMGALEALNGIILFGMMTAFLFAAIHRAWPLASR